MVTKDSAFLALIRAMPCLACGIILDVEAHHIKTRGAGGGDDPWNIIPLCANDHTQAAWSWHRNLDAFLNRYPHIVQHLIGLGWSRVDGMLVHPGYQKRKPKQKAQYTIKPPEESK